MSKLPLSELDPDQDGPAFAWFYSMQPSEFDQLDLVAYGSYKLWMNEFLATSQPAKARR